MELTEKNIESYVKSGGVHCPYCGSHDITTLGGIMLGEEEGTLYQLCACICGERWYDEYALTGVSETEDK